MLIKIKNKQMRAKAKLNSTKQSFNIDLTNSFNVLSDVKTKNTLSTTNDTDETTKNSADFEVTRCVLIDGYKIIGIDHKNNQQLIKFSPFTVEANKKRTKISDINGNSEELYSIRYQLNNELLISTKFTSKILQIDKHFKPIKNDIINGKSSLI
jgi:hypothetical protein